jgi:hypothetical protein
MADKPGRGDWEGWTEFFLRCVCESAEDGIGAAMRLFALLGKDRSKATNHEAATVTAIRLPALLPGHPVITLPRAMVLLQTTKPTAGKAIDALCKAGILAEDTGKPAGSRGTTSTIGGTCGHSSLAFRLKSHAFLGSSFPSCLFLRWLFPMPFGRSDTISSLGTVPG